MLRGSYEEAAPWNLGLTTMLVTFTPLLGLCEGKGEKKKKEWKKERSAR